jgi:hypothetical protein
VTSIALIPGDDLQLLARIRDNSRHDCWQYPTFLSQFASYAYIACAGPTTKRLGTVELGCSGRKVFWAMARFAVPALSALLAMNVSARSPPPLLQIVQERLNPGAEPAYGTIEEQLAALCARMNAPNRYLALASLTLPTEVWWLNAYASPADVDRIAEAYARNTELMTAAWSKRSKRFVHLSLQHTSERRYASFTPAFAPPAFLRTSWRSSQMTLRCFAPTASVGVIWENPAVSVPYSNARASGRSGASELTSERRTGCWPAKKGSWVSGCE